MPFHRAKHFGDGEVESEGAAGDDDVSKSQYAAAAISRDTDGVEINFGVLERVARPSIAPGQRT